MSVIPGTIPVTATLAPTDDTDVFAVTDAIYGIDGLRNVADFATRNAIPADRRRAGMIVGTQSDGQYWKLNSGAWLYDNSDWTLFTTGGGSSGIQNHILAADTVVVPANFQYFVYGDLTLEGTLTNYGQIVVANGALINTGTFNNFGTIIFITLAQGTNKKFKAAFSSTAGVPFTITHNLKTLDIVYDVREGADDAEVQLTRTDVDNVEITTTGNVNGTITIIGY